MAAAIAIKLVTVPTSGAYVCTRRGTWIGHFLETEAAKLIEASRELGGLSRIDLQMSVAGLNHAEMLQGIRLLGEQVAPLLRAAALPERSLSLEETPLRDHFNNES